MKKKKQFCHAKENLCTKCDCGMGWIRANEVFNSDGQSYVKQLGDNRPRPRQHNHYFQKQWTVLTGEWNLFQFSLRWKSIPYDKKNILPDI
ncbi:Threonine--tRNA ligase [Frankliniella fusca]|uniref:Threonine--tRNA ligase n=1 Tax=Frankliniella fusca TaxID=407009 RepID=A0AAE1LR25_9NEOP|nr:Threonine--tRNA ligase [Frankliniella fusca]